MEDRKCEVYEDHGKRHIRYPDMTRHQAFMLASDAASYGRDALIRVFACQPDGTVRHSESWSVLGGRMTLLDSPSIPSAHF